MIYRAARPAAGADDEKLLEWLGISRTPKKVLSEEAIVMAEHTIKTTTDVQQTAAQSAAEETKTYTQAEIEKMSRENIIALGTKLGYTMTTTASDEKSAVVADFMAQQTAAQNK